MLELAPSVASEGVGAGLANASSYEFTISIEVPFWIPSRAPMTREGEGQLGFEGETYQYGVRMTATDRLSRDEVMVFESNEMGIGTDSCNGRSAAGGGFECSARRC